MERNTPLGMVLDKGAMLPKALEIAAKPLQSDFIDVSGFGELGWVEITQSAEDEKPKRFAGPLQLLSLRGRVRRAGNLVISDAVCIVSRDTDNGIQLLGGRMTGAYVNHLEVTLSPLSAAEDLETATLPEPPPPRVEPPPRSAVKSEAVASKQPADNLPDPEISVSTKHTENSGVADARWAKAILEARRIEDEADSVDESTDVRPRQGDRVNHKQFGECSVARIGDDHITLRKPDGRNVQLGLQILSFRRVGHKEGKDVFDVQVSPRK
jgi:hypothetical protein